MTLWLRSQTFSVLRLHRARGFTLIELLVTLGIMSALASVVVPVAQLQIQRNKEEQLRHALWEVRAAIDAYKRAGEEGRIPREAGTSGYPPSLDSLVEGVEDQRHPDRKKIFFLRRVPRDPFSTDSDPSAADTWIKRAYASEAADPQEGDDVYDISSRSPLIGLNGIALKDW